MNRQQSEQVHNKVSVWPESSLLKYTLREEEKLNCQWK